MSRRLVRELLRFTALIDVIAGLDMEGISARIGKAMDNERTEELPRHYFIFPSWWRSHRRETWHAALVPHGAAAHSVRTQTAPGL
jgi:hypothetical protein